MKLNMYSIYDLKSKIYSPPFYCHNTPHALRMFTNIFLEPKTTYNSFPEDFQIFEVGVFDDQNATVVAHPNPTFICTAADLLETNLKRGKHGNND